MSRRRRTTLNFSGPGHEARTRQDLRTNYMSAAKGGGSEGVRQ